MPGWIHEEGSQSHRHTHPFKRTNSAAGSLDGRLSLSLRLASTVRFALSFRSTPPAADATAAAAGASELLLPSRDFFCVSFPKKTRREERRSCHCGVEESLLLECVCVCTREVGLAKD